jgi:hypothetical protein
MKEIHNRNNYALIAIVILCFSLGFSHSIPNAYAAAKVSKLRLNYTSYKLAEGKTLTLKANTDSLNNNIVTLLWSSSNEKVATVSKKGLVTGVSQGNATITVEIKNTNIKTKCLVTVLSDILPNQVNENIVCGIPVKSKDVSGISFVFIGNHTWKKNLIAEYDLLMPRQLVEKALSKDKDIRCSASLGYADENTEEMGETQTIFYRIFMSDGGLVIESENGKYQIAEEMDEYYRLPMKARYIDNNIIDQNIYFKLVQQLELSENSIESMVFIDNIRILENDEPLIICDFDSRYGKRGEQNLIIDTNYRNSTMGFSHGLYYYLSQINKDLSDKNYINVGVVMDGNTPTNDFNSNFSSMTIAFRDKFKTAKTMQVSMDFVIPRQFFRKLTKESKVWVALDLVIDGKELPSTANVIIMLDDVGAPVCYMDDGGPYVAGKTVSEKGAIKIEEKNDAYIFHLTGTTKYEDKSAEEIWFKAKFSSTNVSYQGNWYFNNFKLMEDSRNIIEYNVRKSPYPNNMIEFYTPTTNGIIYNHNESIYGYGQVSLDTLK